MFHHVHHVHLFASDIQKSMNFYQNFFGGQIVLDMEIAGARNVFMKVGSGRIHFYDQAPKRPGPGSIHHFGIQTDDIDGVVERLKAMGVPFKKGVTDIGVWKYVMVPAPDHVLIELFQVNRDALPEDYRSYFD